MNAISLYLNAVATVAHDKYGVDYEEALNIISCISRQGEPVERAAQRVHAISEGEL